MCMKEALKQLIELEEKIHEVWGLLQIEEKKQELKKLEEEMNAPGFWDDSEEAGRIGKKHEGLRSEIKLWENMREEVVALQELMKELESTPDEEMEREVENKIQELQKQYAQNEFLVLMDEKYDTYNAIVSLYAGSGGTEAQDWAEMLLRMVLRFVEKKGWTAVILDQTRGTEAGIKSVTLRVEGRYAYGNLKSEHGTHRLVRISPFDGDKMRHTSFANIEVIPELDHVELTIDPNDLRIDTFMAGGNGGQSVNTTYSAVRIVHVPTGITVQCQNEKSQLQNRAAAMKVLLSRLQQMKDEQEEKEKQALRGEVKSAEWGNQIRSYVLHPYKMVKDVRTRYEESDPEAVLAGGLDGFVEAYLRWRKEDKD